MYSNEIHGSSPIAVFTVYLIKNITHHSESHYVALQQTMMLLGLSPVTRKTISIRR